MNPPARALCLVRWLLACAALPVLAACGGDGSTSTGGPWVVGRWTATSPEGTSEVTFAQDGAGLALVQDGMRVPVRITGGDRYEGEVAQEGVRVRFAFERRGEGLHATYALVTGAGEQALPALDYVRAQPGQAGQAAPAPTPPAPGGPDAWVVGPWRATTPQGVTEVEVRREGDGVVLVSGTARMPLRALGGDRWAGEAQEEGVTLRYEFQRRGEQLVARYTVSSPAGDQAVPEVAYTRVATAAGGAPSGEHPASLLGHWRYTDVLASGGMSLVTDIHLVLEAGGVLRTWSRTEGVASGAGPEVRGRWRLRAGELEVDKGQGWSSLGRAVADGARLMLVQGASKRVYERV